MRLQYGIAIMLAFITCLSAFMLGLGQNDAGLPLAMFFTAIVSLYVTDFRRWIRLGDWTVNAIVLLIVFFTMGDILRNRGEDLALSIARVLVFVEMVLMFREKAPRFCWQILLISLLEVVVATVFQQSMVFGLLLLVYVFSGLLVFLLIFLEKENSYFRRHSFVSTFWEAVRNELQDRQDSWKLARIALITLITGPLSLVFTFEKTNKEEVFEGDKTFMERLRALFAVFPAESVTDSGHWETVTTSPTALEKKPWHNALWDDTTPVSEAPAERKLVAVPTTSRPFRWRRRKQKTAAEVRFPLLRERPGFSAGTLHPNGLEGGKWELQKLLVGGMIVSMFFGVILFCLIPRIGKISMYEFEFVFGHNNWQANYMPPVNTVGFTEEVRLGSLGTVIPYYREVMAIQCSKLHDDPDLRGSGRRWAEETVPYETMEDRFVYLRGVVLDRYENGTWTAQPSSMQISRGRFSPVLEATPPLENEDGKGWGNAENLQPGMVVTQERVGEMYFEENTDLVKLAMRVQPLSSKVFFSPWPFFRMPHKEEDRDSFALRYLGGRVEESAIRGDEGKISVYSTAFRNGEQLDFTPCVEIVRRENLLRIPESGLETLTAMAKQWDAESNLVKSDIVGRARNMEHRFFSDDKFRYKLGGTVRAAGTDPLEDFIRNNPVGHCEYFAGALALMLRSVEIESRVVVGFKTLAKTMGGREFYVRQSDAHTWVEVHLPPTVLQDRLQGPYSIWWRRGAWLRLDPTPDTAAPTFLNSVSFSLTDFSHWIQTIWGEYVLNMDTSKQATTIYQPLREGWQFVLERVFNIGFWTDVVAEIPRRYQEAFAAAKQGRWKPVDWMLVVGPIVAVIVIAFSVRRYAKLLWNLLRKRTDRERRRRITIDFYVRMERILRRYGSERRPAETPREFSLRSAWPTLTAPVIDAYYRVRYGAAELNDDELGFVRRSLDELEKHLCETH